MGPEYEGPVSVTKLDEGVYLVRPVTEQPEADDAVTDEVAGIGDEADHTDEESAEEWLDGVAYYARKIEESGALDDE
jgi:hypothetical protein